MLGRSEGVVPSHAHHAIQVVIALDGAPAVRAKDGQWRAGRGFVVMPNVPHAFGARGALCAMLFVDPESNEGAWLRASLQEDISFVSAARLADCTSEVQRLAERTLDSSEPGPLIRQCIHALCAGAPPARRRDSRISTSLRSITETENLRVSLDDIAATVFLSPSRYAHLFAQQLGLPFRRYILWRKLARSLVLIGRGESLTDAALAADFADAAHLTRTFNKMFGIAPSALMRGEFVEIQSPFDLQD